LDGSAEVAQPGRALDSSSLKGGGEAEDRVVAGSNPALGTFKPHFKVIFTIQAHISGIHFPLLEKLITFDSPFHLNRSFRARLRSNLFHVEL
jgi:hypothetical protein